MGEGSDWITREISQEDEPLRRHYLPDTGALLSQVLPGRPPRCAFFINFFVFSCCFSAVDPVVCCLGHFEVFFFSLFCHFCSILKNVQQAPSSRSGSESSKQTWLACQIGLDSLHACWEESSPLEEIAAVRGQRQTRIWLFSLTRAQLQKEKWIFKSRAHAGSISCFISYLLTSSCLQ